MSSEFIDNNLPIIYGDNVYLRPLAETDTDKIVGWRNQEFVRENFIYQKPFTKEGHLAWIESMIKTGKVIQFMICTKEDRPIGSVYLRDIDATHKKAEYGIFIGEKDALSCGYGTQVAKIVLKYAFEKMRLHKVMLRVLAGNDRAKRSYEKAGFVQEAYLRDEVCLDSGYRDVILMACINPGDKEA